MTALPLPSKIQPINNCNGNPEPEINSIKINNMKKYISILVTCLFAIAFNTQAQDQKTDSSKVSSLEHHCCKKDTTGKACNMAPMKDCKHNKASCCKNDATVKGCNMGEMKNCKHDNMAMCCSKEKSTNEKSCCMKEGSQSCCGSDKKEKSKMKDCPMHKG